MEPTTSTSGRIRWAAAQRASAASPKAVAVAGSRVHHRAHPCAGGGGGFWLRGQLRASLPTLDGSVGRSRACPHRCRSPATRWGFRRSAALRAKTWPEPRIPARAGSLLPDGSDAEAGGRRDSELVGPRACRPTARSASTASGPKPGRRARLTAHDHGGVGAYTAGVNAGLAALGAAPFEYLLLRQNRSRGGRRTPSWSCSRCS